jgi:hypothetical protein
MTEVSSGTPRRPWTAPVLSELPRLTDLTLVTGGGSPGSGTLFVGGWVKGGK